MIKRQLFTALIISCCLFMACEKNKIIPASTYDCKEELQDSVRNHPKALVYQSILDENRRQGLVGAVMLIKDQDGMWLGASGKADIASSIDVQSCNRFLIASITKTFTATCVFRLIDEGLLSLDDGLEQYIGNSIIQQIENAESAKIRHLLNHTSGIADYYTLSYELDRRNKVNNNWSQFDVLEYAYNKPSTNEVGDKYYYSNTNYLLLGIILEKVSGMSLDNLYQNELFTPLNLSSAYFNKEAPIPEDLVKGYQDLFGDGRFVESEFLYKDELNTADGGIAINAHDLAVFLESLMKGNIVTINSLNEMTTWLDLPNEWIDEDLGHLQNGLGLERYSTSYGYSVGHTGGIDGFISMVQYFPDQDATFVLLINSNTSTKILRSQIYYECIEEMMN